MSRPQRLSAFDYTGPHRYFITFCTVDRRPTFLDASVALMVASQILRTARQSRFALLAYCVMPDHVHLLVEGTAASADLRRFVKRVKQRSGQVYSQGAQAPLWQEGYFDRVLRSEEDARALAGYIVWNPVRAGLVRTPAEYPYLGSDVWTVADLVESVG